MAALSWLRSAYQQQQLSTLQGSQVPATQQQQQPFAHSVQPQPPPVPSHGGASYAAGGPGQQPHPGAGGGVARDAPFVLCQADLGSGMELSEALVVACWGAKPLQMVQVPLRVLVNGTPAELAGPDGPQAAAATVTLTPRMLLSGGTSYYITGGGRVGLGRFLGCRAAFAAAPGSQDLALHVQTLSMPVTDNDEQEEEDEEAARSPAAWGQGVPKAAPPAQQQPSLQTGVSWPPPPHQEQQQKQRQVRPPWRQPQRLHQRQTSLHAPAVASSLADSVPAEKLATPEAADIWRGSCQQQEEGELQHKQPPKADAPARNDNDSSSSRQPPPSSSPARPASKGHILSGADSRTTLMLQGVPKHWTQQMLLQALGEEAKGTFDFLYCPGSSAKGNSNNRGYAFINMTSPQHVVALRERFHKKPWGLGSSGEVCHVTWGSVQGRAALVHRNMTPAVRTASCSAGEWRGPLLFYRDGPHAGELEPPPLFGAPHATWTTTISSSSRPSARSRSRSPPARHRARSTSRGRATHRSRGSSPSRGTRRSRSWRRRQVPERSRSRGRSRSRSRSRAHPAAAHTSSGGGASKRPVRRNTRSLSIERRLRAAVQASSRRPGAWRAGKSSRSRSRDVARPAARAVAGAPSSGSGRRHSSSSSSREPQKRRRVSSRSVSRERGGTKQQAQLSGSSSSKQQPVTPTGQTRQQAAGAAQDRQSKQRAAGGSSNQQEHTPAAVKPEGRPLAEAPSVDQQQQEQQTAVALPALPSPGS